MSIVDHIENFFYFRIAFMSKFMIGEKFEYDITFNEFEDLFKLYGNEIADFCRNLYKTEEFTMSYSDKKEGHYTLNFRNEETMVLFVLKFLK